MKRIHAKSFSLALALALAAAVAVPFVGPAPAAEAYQYRSVTSYWSLSTCMNAKVPHRLGDRPPKVIQKCKRDNGFPGYDWKYYTILVYPDGSPWR